VYSGEPIPASGSYDWLLVLGGSMGVHDTAQYPWLSSEKARIQDDIGSGKTVVGICLGAQLIAESLGARVTTARHREIGWFPITTTPEARGRFPLLTPSLQAVCWHNDTFELPAGAVRLGSSQGCANQGFFAGDRILGLQFHLEWPIQDLRKLILTSQSDFDLPGRYVQRPSDMLDRVEWSQRACDLMSHLLDAMPE
jgi:GMP synthase-like glutamine amidotransferase